MLTLCPGSCVQQSGGMNRIYEGSHTEERRLLQKATRIFSLGYTLDKIGDFRTDTADTGRTDCHLKNRDFALSVRASAKVVP